ncbi:SLC13 family permease [Bacillus testis]|uniref:SLC13 family permease n=1 Tax=Bacillus testis TaxID=1622072 RepID=UPI00067E6678|nr:SLC13 family permease [Bacillus testis]
MTNQPMIITFIILALMFFLLTQGKIRSDLIGFGALLALTVLHIISPEEAIAGFSNPVVIMTAGLFIVGAGIFDSGLAKSVGSALFRMSGNSETKLLVIMFITVGLFSAVLSSAGTVAILLPVIMSIAFESKVNPARFLLPLTFAASIGGLLTLIGAPTNLIISDILAKEGLKGLDFLEISGIGLIAMVAGLIFILTAGRKIRPSSGDMPSEPGKTISASELAGLYKVYDQLHFVHIPDASDIIGERLADLKLPARFEITVIEIERKSKDRISLMHPKSSIAAKANEVIYPGDLLLVFGGDAEVDRFIQAYELEKQPFAIEEIKSHFLRKSYGMTEILLAPHSSLEDMTIADLHIRETYMCNVLAINRKGEYIQSDLGRQKLKIGDALLVYGKWKNIGLLSSNQQDFVVLGSNNEGKKGPGASGKAPVAALIMLLMLVLLTFDILSPLTSILLSAFLMVISGCIQSIEAAYQRVNLEIIVVIATLIPIASAMEKTGGTQFLSNSMLSIVGAYGGYGLLICCYLVVSVLSQFINSMAVTILMAPVALTAALGLGINPEPVLIGIAVAASMSLSTFASPTNILVMTAGGYKMADFIRLGLPLQIFVGILVLIAIPLLFPFV